MSTQDDELIRIQNRINAEDSLLNSRTTIFLLTNGFLLAILGVESYGLLRLAFCFLGIFVTGIWFLIGWQSYRILREFHKERANRFPDSIEVSVSKKALFRPIQINNYLAFWLPLIFMATWIFSGVMISIGS